MDELSNMTKPPQQIKVAGAPSDGLSEVFDAKLRNKTRGQVMNTPIRTYVDLWIPGSTLGARAGNNVFPNPLPTLQGKGTILLESVARLAPNRSMRFQPPLFKQLAIIWKRIWHWGLELCD